MLVEKGLEGLQITTRNISRQTRAMIMGVSGLKRHLEPFASRDRVRGAIIIDGPALAYHIHYLSATEASLIPSCEVLERKCLEWLDCVRRCGLTMQVQ